MTSPIAAINASRASAPIQVDDQELQKTFQQAVAGMIFSEMMKAMRATVGEPAYLHGGQAEKLFQQQMDQQLVDQMAANNGSAFVGDLYHQFRVQLGLPVDPRPAPFELDVSGGSSRLSPPAPLHSKESSNSGGRRQSELAAQAVEPIRQARSGTDVTDGATALSGLTSLFRK